MMLNSFRKRSGGAIAILAACTTSVCGAELPRLCDVWNAQSDLTFIGLDDGDFFEYAAIGQAFAGETFFVDFTVRDTVPGRGYSFFFGPSTEFNLGGEMYDTGFIGTFFYDADGSETDLVFHVEDRFDESGGSEETVFDLTNFRCEMAPGAPEVPADPVDSSEPEIETDFIDLRVLVSTATTGYAVVSGVRQSNYHIFRNFVDALWTRQRSVRLGRANFSDDNPLVGVSQEGGGDDTFSAVWNGIVRGNEVPAGIELATPSEDLWRGFVIGSAASFDQETGISNPGVQADSWSTAVGAERVVGTDLLLGAAISGGGSRGEAGPGVDLDVEGVAGHVYGTVLRNGAYVDLRYAFGSLRTDSARDVGFGSTARATVDSFSHAVYFETGRQSRIGAWSTGPYLGLDYLSGEIDPFAERGGGRFDLNFAGQSYDSLLSEIGWEISRSDDLGDAKLFSRFRAGWAHEFLDGVGGEAEFALATSPVNRLVGGRLVPFGPATTGTFAIEEPGDDYLSLGLGFAADLVGGRGPFRACRLSLDYETQLFREDFFEQQVSASATLRF